MLTGYGNIPTAVAAIKQGAIDDVNQACNHTTVLQERHNAVNGEASKNLLYRPKSLYIP